VFRARAKPLRFSHYFRFGRSQERIRSSSAAVRKKKSIKVQMCVAMYTRRAALSLKKKKNLAHTHACVRARARFYERIYLWTVFLGAARAAILRAPSVSRFHFPIAFLSPCPLTHSFARPLEVVRAERFITMTLRQRNRRTSRIK